MKPQRLRAIAVAEWRGLPEMPLTSESPQAISGSIAKLMAKLGLGERLREEEILAAWRDIVGDFVSRHSTPAQLKDGVLVVRVLQPTVHYELDRVWKRQILEKLKLRFGARTVREVRFRIG
jgi:predicted nucleic acid-binding Zn ribbon protein